MWPRHINLAALRAHFIIKKRRFRDPEERERRRREGQIIVVELLARGWRQVYLAEEVGCSVRSLLRWCDGVSAPPKSKMKALRELVG